ncbi:hypothetical protein [uncultured Ramlibacter sp.]|uniref:hypothetical protein n=1 Tax=uncultured Ramlibacter sp. TaxID=260755 RepID=UPI002608F810|nr:hypothetical protein [uncultured Ramlibacter sp.]
MPTPIFLTVAATGLAALGAWKRRRRLASLEQEAQDEDASPDSALPALAHDDALAVLAAAEVAAIKQGLGGPPTPNPHPLGTRARILWETHYGVVLMDWDS